MTLSIKRHTFKGWVLALLLAIGAILSLTVPVSAASYDPLKDACSNGAAAQGSDFCQNAKSESSNRSLVYGTNSLLLKIAQTIIYITGAVSVIMIVIGGFRYVTSNGDSNSLSGAKNTILYAIVGLVITVFSQAIVSFVLGSFL